MADTENSNYLTVERRASIHSNNQKDPDPETTAADSVLANKSPRSRARFHEGDRIDTSSKTSKFQGSKTGTEKINQEEKKTSEPDVKEKEKLSEKIENPQQEKKQDAFGQKIRNKINHYKFKVIILIKNDEWVKALLAFLLILIASALALFVGFEAEKKLTKNELLIQIVDQLKTEFPSQPDNSWKIVTAAVKSVLRPGVKRPSVLILLTPSGSEETSSILGKALAKEIEKIFDSESQRFIHEQGRKAIAKIADERKLKEHIEYVARFGFSNGKHALLFEDFHVIPSESALMFHGLCDDTEAPFKDVVYLLTMAIDDVHASKDLKGYDITSVWEKKMKLDFRSSLRSRLDGFKFIVRPEKNLKFE